MTTLAANKPREYSIGDTEEYPVVADDKIFDGAAVGENGSGYARPLQAGDVFLGFANGSADNTGGSAGDVRVSVIPRGRIDLPISAIAITANDGAAVYASDDDTFTLTASTNSLIGYVSRWVETGLATVRFDREIALAVRQALAADGG